MNVHVVVMPSTSLCTCKMQKRLSFEEILSSLGNLGMCKSTFVFDDFHLCSKHILQPLIIAESHSMKEGPSFMIALFDLKFGDQMGRSAMGVVFKGQWKSRNFEVAIKRLSTQLEDKEVRFVI